MSQGVPTHVVAASAAPRDEGEGCIFSVQPASAELRNKDVPQRNDPSRRISVPLAKRILYISLYGKQTRGSDEAVLEFLSALNVSNIGSDRADKPRLVAQVTDEKNNIMNYVIECVFMPL